jgi:hypothetical protein
MLEESVRKHLWKEYFECLDEERARRQQETRNLTSHAGTSGDRVHQPHHSEVHQDRAIPLRSIHDCDVCQAAPEYPAPMQHIVEKSQRKIGFGLLEEIWPLIKEEFRSVTDLLAAKRVRKARELGVGVGNNAAQPGLSRTAPLLHGRVDLEMEVACPSTAMMPPVKQWLRDAEMVVVKPPACTTADMAGTTMAPVVEPETMTPSACPATDNGTPSR